MKRLAQPDAADSHTMLLSDHAQRGAIAPGLLQVLRQAVGLRFAVFTTIALAFVSMSRVALGPPPGAAWLGLALATEAGALFLLVMSNRARVRLGEWFLPIAVGWFLLASLIEQAIMIVATPSEMLTRFGHQGVPGVGIEAIFLVVPVILATWQYGKRGLVVTLATLAAGLALLTPLVGFDPAIAVSYVIASLGRLTMIALLGYVVLRLVNGLRAEHDSLVAANRQLAQRAATVEQLAESRERNRLARELHDTLAHSFSGLSVQLKALETLMAHDDHDAAQAQLTQAMATVRSGSLEARRAIQALRAMPLEDLGLSEALRQLCAKLAERSGLFFHCDIADPGALDPLTEQTIFRVAESALANVEQHAGAAEVWVSLEMLASDGLRLAIRDDGVGFDPAAAPQNRFGLAGMRERADLIGADLRIESTLGRGALVLLETNP